MTLHSNFEHFTAAYIFYYKTYGVDLLSPTNVTHRCLFFCVIANCLLVLGHQVAFLFAPGDRLADRPACVPIVNYYLIGLGKVLTTIWNLRALTQNYHNLRTHYPSADVVCRYRLQHHLRTYSLVAKFLGNSFVFVLIVYCIYPVAQTISEWWWNGVYTYRLPLVQWQPVELEHSLWIYVIYFVLGVSSSIHIRMAILGSDLCLFASVSQLTLHFDLLAQQILELQPQEPESLVQLKDIIERHQTMLRLAGDIDRIFTPSIIFSLMSSSFILCFCAYQLLGDVSLLFIGKALLLLAYEMKQVVITCYFGDKLTESSARLFDVVYAHDWIDGSPEYKRLVLIMLTRTRHPFVLKVAGIADVSLITLKRVLSMSYQIFAVLKTT